MDVNHTNSAAPTHPDGRKPSYHRDQSADNPKDKEDQKAPSGSWRDEGAVAIDGGLIEAFTPEVQGVIDALTREIEPLRRQLEAADQRADEFKRAAGQHTFLEIPNRREFLRELNHVIAHRPELSMAPVLTVVHLANADQIRRKLGRHSLDLYLTEISQRLGDAIQSTDVLGSLSGNDFAILILGSGLEQAQHNISAVIDQVCSQPVFIEDNRVPVQLLSGTVEIGESPDGTSALAKADRNLSGQA